MSKTRLSGKILLKKDAVVSCCSRKCADLSDFSKHCLFYIMDIASPNVQITIICRCIVQPDKRCTEACILFSILLNIASTQQQVVPVAVKQCLDTQLARARSSLMTSSPLPGGNPSIVTLQLHPETCSYSSTR